MLTKIKKTLLAFAVLGVLILFAIVIAPLLLLLFWLLFWGGLALLVISFLVYATMEWLSED
jgi:hypothetical protein